MKGKQNSNIIFDGYDHMDAELLSEWGDLTIRVGSGGPWPAKYQSNNSPFFANSIYVCEDETVIDPSAEATKDQLNKFSHIWRKIFDDEWMVDSHYWFCADIYIELYFGNPRTTGLAFIFPHFKNMDSLNTAYEGPDLGSYGNSSLEVCEKNHIAIARTRGGYGSTDFHSSPTFNDYIDGKIYRLKSETGMLGMHFSQNGIDWYMYKLPKVYSDGFEAHWGYEYNRLIFLPYTLHDDYRITLGKHKVIAKNINYGRAYFTLGNNLLGIERVQQVDSQGNSEGYGMRVTKYESNGHCTITDTKWYYYCYFYYLLPSQDNTKQYFIYYYRYNNSMEDTVAIAYVDSNGLIHNVISGYEAVKAKTITDGKGLIDDKTGYIYFYNGVGYTNQYFPKSGGNYNRIIIARTRDYSSFTYMESPPYRLLQGNMGNRNALAVCMDSAYWEYCNNNYFTTEFLAGIKVPSVDQGGSNSRFCCHNEKICHSKGVLGSFYNSNMSSSTREYQGIIFYFDNFDLTESNKDFLYSLFTYDENNQRKEFISQSVINQINGLDYPGKDD